MMNLHLQHGFTFTETLFSLALIGLLSGIALPAYQVQWQQSRRQDAQNSLLQLQFAQARWRGQNAQYTNQASDLGWAGDLSLLGHYQLRLSEATEEGFVATATAVGNQSRDTRCAAMALRLTGGNKLVRTSGASLQDDPGQCWKW
jgi:type IV pilus assembly protein PilE